MPHVNRSAVLQPLDAGNLVIASEVVSASGLSTTREELQRQWSLPDATLVGAWQDGRLVGVAGAISYGASGVIGPMSVLPEMQGSGIGTALLRHVLDWLHRSGTEVITLDATPAGAPLYRHHGFVRDHWTLHMVRDGDGSRPDAGVHGEEVPWHDVRTARKHIWGRMARPQDARAIADFDAPLFGASRRGPLLAYLQEYRERTLLVHDAEQIKGYAIAQTRRIGPIVAVDASVAELLLDAILSLPFQEGQVISLAESNAAGIALVAKNGFMEARRLERMRLGGTVHPGVPTYHYAILSYALG